MIRMFNITEPTHPSFLSTALLGSTELAKLKTKIGLDSSFPSVFVDKNTSPVPQPILVPMYLKTLTNFNAGLRGGVTATLSSNIAIKRLHVLLPFEYKKCES